MQQFNLLPKSVLEPITKTESKKSRFHAVIINSPSQEMNYQMAIYWACQIVCRDNNWCRGTCSNCYRIINNNYYDFVILNPDSEKINKERIINLINKFSLSALEVTNKKIYLIQNLEEGSIEANNTLLKFLEEPPVNTYAIITSKDINQVLETIISRCQVITMPKPKTTSLITRINETWKTSAEDAMLLSNCFYTFSEITQQINYLEFSVIKELVLAFLNNLISDNVRANNLLVNEIIKLEKKSLQIFWKLIILAIKDSFLKKPKYFISQAKLMEAVQSKINKHQNFFLAITYECLEKLKLFVNKNLLVDYFVIKILKI